jgi:hypothetical protein
MSPAEWWAEFDTKQAAEKRLNGQSSSFGADKWADARRRHKERKREEAAGGPRQPTSPR